jgi:hypothetical protein
MAYFLNKKFNGIVMLYIYVIRDGAVYLHHKIQWK